MDTEKKSILVITETYVNCHPDDFLDDAFDDAPKYIPDPEWRRNGNTYELKRYLGEI